MDKLVEEAREALALARDSLQAVRARDEEKLLGIRSVFELVRESTVGSIYAPMGGRALGEVVIARRHAELERKISEAEDWLNKALVVQVGEDDPVVRSAAVECAVVQLELEAEAS